MTKLPSEKDEAAWWQPSLILFGRLSGWIGVPIILSLFLGKWLDEKYGTEPWLFLLTVGVAFVVSSIGIVKESVRAIGEMAKEEEEARCEKAESQDRSVDK